MNSHQPVRHAARSAGATFSLIPDKLPGEKELSAVSDLVRVLCRVNLPDSQMPTLRLAIRRRMNRLAIKSIDPYMELLSSTGKGKSELCELVSLVSIFRTSFFRTRTQFYALKHLVLPATLRRKAKDPRSPITIWSAGCSTGEEPLSIAMTIRDCKPTRRAVNILATDVHLSSLETAGRGRYQPSDLDSLSQEERAFFNDDDGFFTAGENLQSMISYQPHNLVSDNYPAPPEGQWDIIFCRNLLTGFEPETVRHIIDRFRKVLAPEGHLFLGVGESLGRSTSGFMAIDSGKLSVYRKRPERSSTQEDSRTTASPAKLPLEEGLTRAKRKLQAGDREGAVSCLIDLASRYQENVSPCLLLGRIAASDFALEEARSWYLKATELKPMDTVCRFRLAMALYRMGLERESAKELRRLLFVDGSFALGHYFLGMVSESLGDLDAALRSFHNTLKTCETSQVNGVGKLLKEFRLTPESLVEASLSRINKLERMKVPAGRSG